MIIASVSWAARDTIYDSDADGRTQLQRALTLAKASDKRVLVQWGANWCGWCYKLHDFFKENKEAGDLLAANYVVVLIDSDHNKAFMRDLKVEPKGIPYLTVFDADGTKLVDQDTGSLETGSRHDPDKVNRFLKRWTGDGPESVEWQSFDEQLDDAKARAKAAEKNVLLVTGTDWCGWCRRLEALLENEIVKPLIEKNYIVVHVNEQKSVGAKSFRTDRAGKESRGVPWYAVVAPGGKVIATSDLGGKNTGYPASPREIEKFMRVIDETARHLDPQERVALEAEVRRIGKAFAQ